MIVVPTPEQQIFLDYLDEENEEWGYKLVDSAPQKAIDALASYRRDVERLAENASYGREAI